MSNGFVSRIQNGGCPIYIFENLGHVFTIRLILTRLWYKCSESDVKRICHIGSANSEEYNMAAAVEFRIFWHFYTV